ncbi:MAG: heavy metal translocating P-type ATPase [Phycisphaerales bacterium]|nr:heavy metal translocating P-type ATPase [Phycisphaerales bacterium]
MPASTLTAGSPPPRASTPSAPHSAAIHCAHCGLTVPPGQRTADDQPQFCCAGCRAIHHVIHDCGLEAYYHLRDAQPGEAARIDPHDRSYAEFDNPAFSQRYCRAEGPLLRCELALSGVHCAACVWLIERLPRVVPGVIEARLEWARGIVSLSWDPQRVPLSRIARGLASLGYEPRPARGGADREAHRDMERRQLVRIAVAGACAGNAMLPAVAMYGGLFSGMDPVHESLLRWASMAIGVVALAWPGATFFRGAWAALRTRTGHLDVPIALALLIGGTAGVVNTLRGIGEIYFDSLTVLVFLLLVGRFLQTRRQRSASETLEALFALTPHSARRLRADGATEDVPLDGLLPGDLVEVRAGETIPADGRIVSGESAIDASILTGESRPVPAIAGQGVHAGTLNLHAAVRIEVLCTGEETRVGRLTQLVARAAQRRAPIVLLADRIAGWFVAAVIVLAAATLLGWWSVSPVRAADHAVALLIIACPCALGLATPLTVAVAIGRAARRGILIKGGDVLERLSRPGRMLLDKTGTLTHGRFELLHWTGPDDSRRRAAALEAHSAHPVGRALAEALAENDDPLECANPGAGPPQSRTCAAAPDVTCVEQHADGIRGRVDGREVLIGAPRFIRRWLSESEAPLPDALHRSAAACAERALTTVWIAEDGCVVAVAGLGDRIRADAAPAVRALRDRGWRLGLLSGDHPSVATATAAQIGFRADEPVIGSASPEDKLHEIERLMAAERGPIVMVGDGVNDAAALAAAHVGVAVRGGAEASLAAADVYLNRAGLEPILEMSELSVRTMRSIRRCLVASLAYNLFGVSLAAAGWLNPLIAAIMMPISSLTVLALASRVNLHPVADSSAVSPQASEAPAMLPVHAGRAPEPSPEALPCP